MIDLKELRRLAEGATSGPWKSSQLGLIGPGIDNFIAQELWLPDMDFIAAVNPVVMLELLDELEDLRNRMCLLKQGLADMRESLQ